MNAPGIRTITRLDEFTARGGLWNDLWTRSDVTLPTVTAGGIAGWCRTFAPDSPFLAVVLEQQNRWIGGLPLVGEKRFGLPFRWRLPSNCWSAAGDLLLDPRCDHADVCRQIIDALADSRYPLLDFELIERRAARWQAFRDELAARSRTTHESDSYHVGVVDILHDWDAYTRSWSANHRQAVRKSKRQLEARGDLRVERIRDDSPRLQSVLRACFEVEDAGWKGDQGSSVLKTPGMFEYYLDEARAMAASGMLDLWILRFDGEIIAFEYCYQAKGTCFSHKISFDPRWSKQGPGRLLRYFQLEALHRDPETRLLDTLGILCPAKAKWSTRSYTLGRLMADNGSSCGRLALRCGWRAKRLRQRGRDNSTDLPEPPKLGAAAVPDRAKRPRPEDSDDPAHELAAT